MAHTSTNSPVGLGLPDLHAGTGLFRRLRDALGAVFSAPRSEIGLNSLGQRELEDIGLRRMGDTGCLRDRYHRV